MTIWRSWKLPLSLLSPGMSLSQAPRPAKILLTLMSDIFHQWGESFELAASLVLARAPPVDFSGMILAIPFLVFRPKIPRYKWFGKLAPRVMITFLVLVTRYLLWFFAFFLVTIVSIKRMCSNLTLSTTTYKDQHVKDVASITACYECGTKSSWECPHTIFLIILSHIHWQPNIWGLLWLLDKPRE